MLLVAVLCWLAAGCTSAKTTVTTTTATTSTAASSSAVPPPTIAANSGFVTRSGRQLLLDGKQFRFVGANLYDAAGSDRYSCNAGNRLSDAALLATLRYLHDSAGATVLRFWAYQTYTAGGTDFSGTDRFIAAARKAGLRVMPVLEDGPGDCSTGKPGVSLADADGGTWFAEGYKQPYGTARRSYRDYVQVMAQHYRDNPTIVAWTMVNEAETPARDTADRPVLAAFAADVAAVIHAADPRHLVTLGTQGNGAPGASGKDFAAVYGQDGLDLTEVHDWNRYGSDTEAMPGSKDGSLPREDSAQCRATDAKIACSFAIAQQLGKPIVVGEAGVEATDAAGRARRADLLGAKMKAAFAANASGYLVWHLNRGATDNLDVIPGIQGQDEPLFGVMSGVAKGLQP